jgi:hypothetical protein
MFKNRSISGNLVDISLAMRMALWLSILFLGLIVYDGAIRKWLFINHERYVYLLKDLTLLGVASLILLSRRWSLNDFKLPKIFLIPFLLYSLYVLIQALNPKLPNFLVGVWGIRNHLFYSLIAFAMVFGGLKISEVFDLTRRLLPWIVLPVCAVALLQTVSPMDSWLNDPVRGGQFYVSNMANNLVRTSATFSYITGFAWYLQAMALFTIALLFRSKGLDWLVILCVTMLLIALPTNGSRSVMLVFGASLLILISALWFFGMIKTLQVAKIAAGLSILGLLSYVAFPDAWGALIHRFLSSHTTPGDSARYWTIFTNAFVFFDLSGPFGFGPGTASQAAPFLVPNLAPYSWLPPGIGARGFEEESGRLVLELGVVGWILSLSLRTALVVLSIRLLVIAKHPDIKLAAAIALPVMLHAAYVGNGVFAPPVGSAFFWFGVGLLLVGWREESKQ